MPSIAKRGASSSDYHSDANLRYVVIACWCAILLGVFLRVAQLPTRVVYLDEIYTQLRVAGHTADEMMRAVYDGTPTTAATLSRFARVDASASPQRLVTSLELEDSQHPPLFYLLELAVVSIFGNALVYWRLLPAIFGILAIPAAYLLARELFKNGHAALLAATIFAVSPIERIYSTQAREYSLFVLLVLVSTFCLARAMRINAYTAWIGYLFLAAAGLYADPIMAYVIAAHAIFVAGISIQRRRLGPAVMFGISCTLAFAAYAPWIAQMLMHRRDLEQTNVWSATHWPLVRLAAKWLFNTGSTIFDLEYLNLRWGTVAFIPVAIVAAVALVRGFAEANTTTRWCLGAAILVPAILLIAPDVVLGQHRSSVARYGLPIFAMLAIALGRGLVGRPISTTILVGAGLCACTVGAFHSVWWDNDSNADDGRIARVVNTFPRAQVLTTLAPPMFIGYARLLDPTTRVSLSPRLAKSQFSRNDPVLILLPNSDDLRLLQERFDLRTAPVPFTKTPTAHDIGAAIGTGGGSGHEAVIYRGLDDSRSAREPNSRH